MSNRGPYSAPLERFVSCVCYVLLVKEIVSMNKAAVKCGVDPRTVRRYATQDLHELNTRVDKECGKMVIEKCAKQGLEITETLGGALRDRRKVAVSGCSPKKPSNPEEQSVSATELESEANGIWQHFRSFYPDRETSFEPKLLSSQTKVCPRYRPDYYRLSFLRNGVRGRNGI